MSVGSAMMASTRSFSSTWRRISDAPALQPGALADLGARGLNLCKNCANMLEQCVPGVGQPHIASNALEQRHPAQLVFEVVDLLAYRRLCYGQLGGGARDMLVTRNSLEVDQVA